MILSDLGNVPEALNCAYIKFSFLAERVYKLCDTGAETNHAMTDGRAPMFTASQSGHLEDDRFNGAYIKLLFLAETAQNIFRR